MWNDKGTSHYLSPEGREREWGWVLFVGGITWFSGERRGDQSSEGIQKIERQWIANEGRSQVNFIATQTKSSNPSSQPLPPPAIKNDCSLIWINVSYADYHWYFFHKSEFFVIDSVCSYCKKKLFLSLIRQIKSMTWSRGSRGLWDHPSVKCNVQ